MIDEASEGQRLDNFLVKLLKGVPKTHVYRVIRSGEVRVNKGRAGADTRLAMGDEVRIPPVRVADRSEVPAAPAREFPVVYEDDFLLAIDKPAGVAVHGGSGVSSGVIEQLRQARPTAKFLELVHRLDKETSGLLLIAKKRSALVALQDQLRQRETGKTYAALVIGAWPARRKVIDVALHKTLTAGGERRVHAVDEDHEDGRRSITLVKIAQQFAAFTLLDVTIKTGRTHQIRVHLDARRPRDRRRREVRRLRAQQGAGAWRGRAGLPLRPHVPAREIPALHAPRQQRGDRARRPIAGRMRST